MKITKQRLKEIIKEELSRVLNERVELEDLNLHPVMLAKRKEQNAQVILAKDNPGLFPLPEEIPLDPEALEDDVPGNPELTVINQAGDQIVGTVLDYLPNIPLRPGDYAFENAVIVLKPAEEALRLTTPAEDPAGESPAALRYRNWLKEP